MQVKIFFAFMLLLSSFLSADFVISSTHDFDSGIKINTSTATDRFIIDENVLELDFPYYTKAHNPISFWRFEDNFDDEFGVHNGSCSLCPNYTDEGWLGSAYNFIKDSGHCIRIPDHDDFSFANSSGDKPFSVSAWVKTQAQPADQKGILSKDTSSAGSREWSFFIASDRVGISLRSEGGNNEQGILSSIIVPSNEWVHVAATYDGRGGDTAYQGLNIYINSTLSGVNSFTNQAYVKMNNTTADVLIGIYPGGTKSFSGTIDEVRIFSTNLSQEQVNYLYNDNVKFSECGFWKSGSLYVPKSYRILYTAIEYSNVDANNYIDKIEWVKEDQIVAEYDLDIKSGNYIEILDYSLTSGNFESISGEYSVKIYLAGNGSFTPTVESITGMYTPPEEKLIVASGFDYLLVLIMFSVSFFILVNKVR